MVKENLQNVMDDMKIACEKSGRNINDVTLIAVSKTKPNELIMEAYETGIRDFGENKVQELLSKYDEIYPERWHLIGHLQTNKVKQVIDKVTMIHSVDSIKLAKEIDKRAAAADLVMDILIEINLAEEESKTGIAKAEVFELVASIVNTCDHIRVRGIMCIPPRGDTPEDSRKYFREARSIYDKLRNSELPTARAPIDTLSMGMSADFEIAIEEGATIVRVGSSIFGQRDYR